MTEAEKKFLVDLQGLLFFKSEQDKENLEKFIKKDEALSSLGAVSYLIKQNLTETQKAQARENIGAGTGNGTGSIDGAVRYDVEQALSDGAKERARENIGTTDGTWESMPDKPFGETGWEVAWDGNPETALADPFLVEAMGATLYKISNETKTKGECVGALARLITTAGEGGVIEDTIANAQDTDSADCFVLFNSAGGAYFVVALKDGTYNFMSIPFELSEGIWAIVTPSYTPLQLGSSVITKIDKKYLPDDINVELPDGLVTTDENGLIPASVLPSYVDDVVEGHYDGEKFYQNYAEHAGNYFGEITPESGKIYVDLNTGNTYRWSGSVYVRLNPDEYTIATNEQILELFN